MNRFDRTMQAVYSLLLNLYPSEFKEQFGDEIASVFTDGLEEASHAGLAAQISYTLHEFRGILHGLVQVWMHALRPGRIRKLATGGSKGFFVEKGWCQMADIKSTFQAIGYIAVVLLILFIFLSPLFWVGLTYGENYEWIFTPRIPLPEDASNVEVNFPSMGGTRSTTYETNLPAEAVVDFYHNILPKRGFHYVCGAGQIVNPVQDCPEWIATNPYFLEYFIKGDMAVLIGIRENDGQEAADGKRISISERDIKLWPLVSKPAAVTPAPARAVMTPGAYPWPGAASPTPLSSYP